MALSSHTKRLITAFALLPALLWTIFAGGNWLFGGLLLVCYLGLWEFYSLFWSREGLGKKLLGLALCTALLVAARRQDPQLIIALLLAAFWLGGLLFLFSYSRAPGKANYLNAAVLVGGLLYLPLSLHFFLFFQPAEIFLVLVAAFLSDTGAYYAGTYFGRRKLWPSISPKKTWEGGLGGLLTCMLSVLTLGLIWGNAPWWSWLVLAALLNIAAQFGDFFESALKRWLSVKDSGTLLPGHGGLLDRIDSLLLVVPIYAACRALMPFFS
ncbi:MAG: phosphatidate cytidylyltransferase [Desulfocurvibacter africanus]